MSAPTHFVHVYATVRVKLGVTAHDQFAAMKEADRLLFANGFGVRLIPSATGVLEADYAEEVSGYLVDEGATTNTTGAGPRMQQGHHFCTHCPAARPETNQCGAVFA